MSISRDHDLKIFYLVFKRFSILQLFIQGESYGIKRFELIKHFDYKAWHLLTGPTF